MNVVYCQQCMIDSHFVNTGKVMDCMAHAMAWIQSFDIILINSWMNDARTEQYVNQMFMGQDTAHYVRMKDVLLMPVSSTKERKRGSDVMIGKEVYERLRLLNEWDLQLFAYAKELAFKRQKAALTNST